MGGGFNALFAAGVERLEGIFVRGNG